MRPRKINDSHNCPRILSHDLFLRRSSDEKVAVSDCVRKLNRARPHQYFDGYRVEVESICSDCGTLCTEACA